MIQLHLIGAKTAAQMEAHAALLRAHAEAAESAKAAGKLPPEPPKPPALKFHGYSGRGVRLRELDIDERDKVAEIVAKNVGEGGLAVEFNRLRERGCVHKCIVEVTKERELDEAGLAKATWVRVTEEQLEDSSEKYSAKALFTIKDMTAIIVWYRDTHDVSQEDVAVILGKARELAD